jgi:hypothetical protein
VKLQVRRQFPGDTGARRVEFLQRNGSNAVIGAPVLYIQPADSPADAPWIQAPASNSGIGFAGGNVTALFNDGNLAAFTAGAYNGPSSIEVKTAIAPVRSLGSAARDLIAETEAYVYKYKSDLDQERNWPEKPGMTADDGQVELEWSCKPYVAPWHVGPMAEDLPEWMVTRADDGGVLLNVDNKVGVLWQVCREQEAELRDLRRLVDELVTVSPRVVDGEVC